MKIIIDQGNTAAKVAIFDGRELVDIIHFEPLVAKSDLKRILKRNPAIDGGIFCTTAAREQELEEYLVSVSILIFDKNTKIPLKNLYHTPFTLGLDRLAAAVGAWHQFQGQDILLFDLGSAITVDFISASGEYLGGNISAGLAMRLAALHQFTGRLPQTEVDSDFSYTVGQYGKETKSALVLGAVRGICHEIEGYICENRNKIVIFTGGDALFFEKQIKKPIFVNCRATLDGLLSILEYNA